MTRLWQWAVLGAVLPAVWLVAMVWVQSDPQYRAGFLGYALLMYVIAVIPAVVLFTLLGALVLTVARRLPARGDARRGRALAVAVVGCAVVTTVVGALLASGGGVAVTFAPEVLGWSALVVGLPLTACAAAAWSRWRPDPADAVPSAPGGAQA
ncbi:hypothetical protein [Cellulomonas sp. Marseille-Q8402]